MNPFYPDAVSGYGLRWKPARQYRRQEIPNPLLDWLLDTASLTHRLEQACPGGFAVRLIHQGWGRPWPDERRALGMRQGHRALIRQVHLLCGARAWVYARTVIPARSLGGRQRRLGRLGNRPLGAVLFADPSMRRGPLELARIRRGLKLYADATRGLRIRPAEIWGRRSLFRVAGKPLLVAEIFLPQLETEHQGLMVHYQG